MCTIIESKKPVDILSMRSIEDHSFQVQTTSQRMELDKVEGVSRMNEDQAHDMQKCTTLLLTTICIFASYSFVKVQGFIKN